MSARNAAICSTNSATFGASWAANTGAWSWKAICPSPRAGPDGLHGHEPRVGVDQHALHVGEIGHVPVVQPAVRGVIDRLVEGVRADADRGPAEVELPDVHGVERGVPGVVALGDDVRLG